MVGVRPIGRVLIANRGEIACRIARTAHRLGIDTVGVYAEPDRTALHVDMVDVAVALGGFSPAESYLQAERLIGAAASTGCDAVHPGYGFLAENADFARAVIDAGLVWVGPTPEQIALLGDKVAGKRTAAAANVPVSPVTPVAAGSVPEGAPIPAVIKAVAGGGGRGMRIVRDAADLGPAIAAASREAVAAFGDGSLFIEPYVEGGRHVEVQIVGDAHGNIIHLGERECSIQRRSQKIIEEAPSPGITTELRKELWDGALAIAQHVGYQNAGTVEFLVGPDGEVVFLEVNTRLQVEHPVTEAVTGLDLVELQLKVAAGEPLPLTQDDVRFAGHAIEARLVAEDPASGWLPQTGTLAAFSVDGDVRTDTGVRPGSTISAEYDSLLAKVIAHAPERAAATRILARALRSAEIAGPVTNRDTLVATLFEPDFVAGRIATDYFDGHPAVLAAAGVEADERLALLLAAVVHRARSNRAADSHWHFVRPGWRNLATLGERTTWLDAAGRPEQVEERWTSSTAVEVLVGPWPEPDAAGALPPDDRRRLALRILSVADGRLALEIAGLRHSFETRHVPRRSVAVRSPTAALTWTVLPRFAEHTASEAGSGPTSPLPGTVIAVHVTPGQTVEDGDVLMVVEAMKMEHQITAAAPGIVTEVFCAVGDRVDTGDLLLRLEAAAQ